MEENIEENSFIHTRLLLWQHLYLDFQPSADTFLPVISNGIHATGQCCSHQRNNDRRIPPNVYSLPLRDPNNLNEFQS